MSTAVAEKPKAKKSEVVALQAPTPMTEAERYSAIVTRAMSDPSVDMDKLERLCALMEKATERDKEAEFNAALRKAQSQMGRISADATNPQTKSKYATYAKLDSVLRPIYTSEGFSLSFNTEPSPLADHVRVLAYVSHSAGHTRKYTVDMPNDGMGAKGGAVMTKTHAAGAAMSYGSRYLLKMVFNVAVGEDDKDGNAPQSERQQTIPDAHIQELVKLMTADAFPMSAVLAHLKVSDIKLINQQEFVRIVKSCNSKTGRDAAPQAVQAIIDGFQK